MELSAATQAWVNLILVWIGFGTVVGFMANMFLPAGNSPGLLGNLVIGIAGSCAGPVAFAVFLKPQHFHPMSPLGFFVAIVAAIILLILYRILRFFVETPEEKTSPISRPLPCEYAKKFADKKSER